MNDIIFIGSGGCMRELLYQIENLNRVKHVWNVLGYVDKEPKNIPGCAYLGDDEWLLRYDKPAAVCISVQEPKLRKKLAKLYHQNPNLSFPVLRMHNSQIADSTTVGEGTIFCEDTKVTNDGSVGSFCFFNIGAQVHHDAEIGDYVAIAPNATIAGNVKLQDGCYIGMGAKLIQGISIGKEAVVGAGAVVIKDVTDGATVVGVPAKEICE